MHCHSLAILGSEIIAVTLNAEDDTVRFYESLALYLNANLLAKFNSAVLLPCSG